MQAQRRGREVADALAVPPALQRLAAVAAHQRQRCQHPLAPRRDRRLGVALAQVQVAQPRLPKRHRPPQQRHDRQGDERELRVEVEHHHEHDHERRGVDDCGGGDVEQRVKAGRVVAEAVQRLPLRPPAVPGEGQALQLVKQFELHPRPAAVADADVEQRLPRPQQFGQEPQAERQAGEGENRRRIPPAGNPGEQAVHEAVAALVGRVEKVEEDRQRHRRGHADERQQHDRRRPKPRCGGVVAEVGEGASNEVHGKAPQRVAAT